MTRSAPDAAVETDDMDLTTDTATATATATDTRTPLRDAAPGVIAVLARILGIEDRAGAMTRETGLFGELPELDSLGVVELAAALEDEYDIIIDDEDFTGEVFETVGTLADFVDSRRRGAGPAA